MELRVLKYFLMVAREENITKAAELLHITQPTLSRQLIQLEDELGVLLFERKQHSIELTSEGMLFRQRAQEMIQIEEKIKEVIFNIIKNNINNFYNNLDKAPSSLINKFLKSKELNNEEKLKILINLLNIITEVEKFYKYLKLMNSKDYKNLVKRNTSFSISINEFNLRLLEKLKEKGFIESFSQIDESTYKVITIKDKEKFID